MHNCVYICAYIYIYVLVLYVTLKITGVVHHGWKISIQHGLTVSPAAHLIIGS